MLSDRIIKNSKILIVDDEPANTMMLERLLEWAGYLHIKSLNDPTHLLVVSREMKPDLILLDLHMPGLNGYDALTLLRAERMAYTPILVFTADVTPEARTRALECGANDFLTKPGDSTEILLRVHNFLETRHLHRQLEDQNAALEIRVQERTLEVEHSRLEMLHRLALAADYRDDDTGAHTRRVGELAAAMARYLADPAVDPAIMELAAPLHDVGKIGIPDAILLKPARLEPEEFEVMKTHTTIGAKILGGSESMVLQVAAELALSHHERWDGSGYPQGLSGSDIPLSARIVAVADVFDALTNVRPYKQAWTTQAAIREILQGSGSHFDPATVRAFAASIDTAGDQSKAA